MSARWELREYYRVFNGPTLTVIGHLAVQSLSVLVRKVWERATELFCLRLFPFSSEWVIQTIFHNTRHVSFKHILEVWHCPISLRNSSAVNVQKDELIDLWVSLKRSHVCVIVVSSHLLLNVWRYMSTLILITSSFLSFYLPLFTLLRNIKK